MAKFDENTPGIDITKYKSSSGYDISLNNRVAYFAAQDMIDLMRRCEGLDCDKPIRFETWVNGAQPEIGVYFPDTMSGNEAEFFVDRLNMFLLAHGVRLETGALTLVPPNYEPGAPSSGHVKLPLYAVREGYRNDPDFERARGQTMGDFADAKDLLATLFDKRQSGLDRAAAFHAEKAGRPDFMLPREDYIPGLNAWRNDFGAADAGGPEAQAFGEKVKAQTQWQKIQQDHIARSDVKCSQWSL